MYDEISLQVSSGGVVAEEERIDSRGYWWMTEGPRSGWKRA